MREIGKVKSFLCDEDSWDLVIKLFLGSVKIKIQIQVY